MIKLAIALIAMTVIIVLGWLYFAIIESTERAKCRRARFRAGLGFTLPGEEGK